MPLTHVCVWERGIGYRRITALEADKLYPYSVSVNGKQFVCELCGQNVGFSAPRIDTGTRYFYHSSGEQNKSCEERQSQIAKYASKQLVSFNQHDMPLRIRPLENSFVLEIGFFRPPEAKANCDKIRINTGSGRIFEYSFERIESNGITYLNVGNVPCTGYKLEYINATFELKKYWSNQTEGISLRGSLFDKRTGKLLTSGSKAYSGNVYYLLTRYPLFKKTDIHSKQISTVKVGPYTSWYLYEITVSEFSRYSAQFFLQYSVFLTEKPTAFYPLWPVYIKDSCVTYYNSNMFYYYLCGEDAELRAYPTQANSVQAQEGRLYKLRCKEREQLVSLGRSGTLGFSYLIKQPLRKRSPFPVIEIRDINREFISEEHCNNLPKSKTLYILSPFDGKIILSKNEKIFQVYKLNSGVELCVDGLSYGMKLSIYQGIDHVKSISFEQSRKNHHSLVNDEMLLSKLENSTGIMIPVTHEIGVLASYYMNYPKTRQWLLKAIRQGEICRSAYAVLLNNIQT